MISFCFKYCKFLEEKLHFKGRPSPKATDLVSNIYFLFLFFFFFTALKEQNCNAALGFGKAQHSQRTKAGSPSLVKWLLVLRNFVSSIRLNAVQLVWL